MKKKITKTYEVEVNVCDVCRVETEELLNKMVIAWAKNGCGHNDDAYELCDNCWLAFQYVRDGWIMKAKPKIVDYLDDQLPACSASLATAALNRSKALSTQHNVDASTWK